MLNLSVRALFLSLVLLLPQLPALAGISGRDGFSGSPHTNDGLTCLECHAANTTTTARLKIDGPAVVDANSTNTYTLTLIGGPAKTAGVNISVNKFDGNLTSLDSNLQKINQELSHRSPKQFQDGEVKYRFNWTAPSYNANTGIYAAALSSNNNRRLPGDDTAKVVLNVQIKNGRGTRPIDPIPGNSRIKLKSYAKRLKLPVSIANAGDNRLFVVGQAGTISVVENGQVRSQPFLDISAKVARAGGEQGMLGLAFHPRYASNGFFYVHYNANYGSAWSTRVSRFKVSGNPQVANASSETVIMEFPRATVDHNGGDLKFGSDGYLYLGSGDNGKKIEAQNKSSLLGKILRIDVDGSGGNGADCAASPGNHYRIPPNNAFNNGRGNGCDEIYALGMRNPWRLTFDRQTGDLWIGDVGFKTSEEVNFIRARSSGGLNFGWPCYEGVTKFPQAGCDGQYVPPVHHYGLDVGLARSLTGGYVYRGVKYPELKGRYFFLDYGYPEKIYTLSRINGRWVRQVALNNSGLAPVATFGEDSKGELYVANHGNGEIFQILGADGGSIVPRLSISDSNVTEGVNDVAKVNISLSPAATGTVSVKAQTSDGSAKASSDFTPTSRTVTFNPGRTQNSLNIPILNDDIRESLETFSVVLSQAQGANIQDGEGTVTIQNDDVDTPGPQPTLSVSGVTVSEGTNSRARIKLSLSTAATSRVSVKLQSRDGSAKAGSDYRAISETLIFNPGQRERATNVVILNDDVREATETFNVVLAQAEGATIDTGTARVTIKDDDQSNAEPTLSAADITVNENSGQAALLVRLSAASSEPVSVKLQSRDGSAKANSDYKAVSKRVTFRPGQRERSIDIEILNDTVAESSESFNVQLLQASGARITTNSALITINDDDQDVETPLPVLSVSGVTVSEGTDARARVMVRLSAQARTDISVKIHSQDGIAKANSDYLPISQTLTFAAGQRVKSVDIEILDDEFQENTESFKVQISQPQGATIGFGRATVTIKNDDFGDFEPLTLSVSDAVVAEGGSARALVKVKLSRRATASVSFLLETADGSAKSGDDYQSISQRVTLRPGNLSATLKVPIVNDDKAEQSETFKAVLSQEQGASVAVRSATITIKDDDGSNGSVRLAQSTNRILNTIKKQLGEIPRKDFKSNKARRGLSGKILRIEKLMRTVTVRKVRESTKLANQVVVRINGCGARPDNNDYVINCRTQKQLRVQLRRLQSNLIQLSKALR